MILGLTDGILTALTLAAGRLLRSSQEVPPFLALRIATASAFAGGIVFLAAELARRNYELVHAERQLNLRSHGYLATTRLGHFVMMESAAASVIAIAANFLGALTPFLIGITARQTGWAPVCFAILMLGLLGLTIAKITYRRTLLWAVGLMLAGLALTALGYWLQIV